MSSRDAPGKLEAPYGLFGLLLRVVLLLIVLTTALNMLVARVWPPFMTERFAVELAEPNTCQDLRSRLERHNTEGVSFRVELPSADRNGADPGPVCWLEVDGYAGGVGVGAQARPVLSAAEDYSRRMSTISQRVEPRLGEVQPLITFLLALLIATLLVIHHRHRRSVRRRRI